MIAGRDLGRALQIHVIVFQNQIVKEFTALPTVLTAIGNKAIHLFIIIVRYAVILAQGWGHVILDWFTAWGNKDVAQDPNCDPDEACPSSWEDNLISQWAGEIINAHGCCLGKWTWRYPNCSIYKSYPGIPYFCAECCDKVTTEFIAYTTPVYIGNPYFADCASIHDCFRDDLNQWWNSECGEMGIAEAEEEYCCGCETG